MKRASSVVLVLVLIACGGSAETSTTTTAPTASTTTTTDGGTVTTADEGNEGLPSGDCLNLSTTLSQASTLGLNPTGDPGDTVQALQNMADAAPAEIADDLELLAAAYGDFLTELEEAGIDFADPTTYSTPAAQAALGAASQALDTAGVAEASANISAYIDSVCE